MKDTLGTSTPPLLSPDFSKEELYALLTRANKPLRMDSLLRMTRLARKYKRKLEQTLFVLQEEGLVIRHQGAWNIAARMKTCSGILRTQHSGAAFVLPHDPEVPDIFIPSNQLGAALHGDSVTVLLLPKKRGTLREGRVIEVVSRNQKGLAVMALKRIRNSLWRCSPAVQKVPALFEVDVSGLDGTVNEFDLLLVDQVSPIQPGLFSATAVRNLHNEDTVEAQELLTKAEHGIPGPFPEPVIREVQAYSSDPGPEDLFRRTNLQDLPFVTIDGKTAKDFDDAVYVEKIPFKSGNPAAYKLLVAIADVAHYVPRGSALDKEALRRGNSYYFPASVEPMLPEELSNGLCSLNPHVPRLVMTVEMTLSSEGAVLDSTMYQGVIQSKARLTYDEIKDALTLPGYIPADSLRNVLPMLRLAKELATAISAHKTKEGRMNFDLPQPVFHITGQGAVSSIAPEERHFAHRMIEEFMISANEAVAVFLSHKHVPFLYRSHPAPSEDKLDALFSFLKHYTSLPAVAALLTQKNRKKNIAPSSLELQKILDGAVGTPVSYTVSKMLLRCMMQAKYTPENEGHFGLGSACYTHFTAPIRRYADLIVHRALKQALGVDESATQAKGQLQSLADQINATERVAVETEREIQKRLTLLYMRHKVGEEFSGIISGVSDFGIFVTLPDYLAEGMIRLSTLKDDYYVLSHERQELRGSRTNQVFALGQGLRVRLDQCNVPLLEMSFSLVAQAKNLSDPYSSRTALGAGKKQRRQPATATRRKAKRSKKSNIKP